MKCRKDLKKLTHLTVYFKAFLPSEILFSEVFYLKEGIPFRTLFIIIYSNRVWGVKNLVFGDHPYITVRRCCHTALEGGHSRNGVFFEIANKKITLS